MNNRWFGLALLALLAGSPRLVAAEVDSSGPLRLHPATISESVAVVGAPVDIEAVLENTSGQEIDDVTVDLFLLPGWRSDPIKIQIPKLPPYNTHRLRFRAMADEAAHGGGRIAVTAPRLAEPLVQIFPLVSCQPLRVMSAKYSMRERHMAREPEGDVLYVTTGDYIIFLPPCAGARGPGLIYVRRGDQWERVGTLPALGRVIYDDRSPDGEETVQAEHWIFPTEVWIPRDPAGDYLMTLKETWEDFSGRQWTAKAWFGPTQDPRVIKVTQAVFCNRDAVVRRYEGPMIAAGDGTFGAAHDGLLTPEPVEEIDGVTALRSGLVDQGVMGVARPGGGVIAWLWNPNQLWTSGKADPHALFFSPNTLYRRQNTYLSLLAPHFGPGAAPTATEARPGMELPAGRPIYLQGELFVTADGGLDAALDCWAERFAPGGPGLD